MGKTIGKKKTYREEKNPLGRKKTFGREKTTIDRDKKTYLKK